MVSCRRQGGGNWSVLVIEGTMALKFVIIEGMPDVVKDSVFRNLAVLVRVETS